MRALVVAVVAGCGFAPAVPSDATTPSVVDDLAADFTGMIEGGVIAPRGAIEPHTYVVGGLHGRGYQADALMIATQTYDQLVASLPAPIGEAYGVGLADWGNDPTKAWPKGVGIGRPDNFTYVVDGEMWLPVGTTTLVLAVDDFGFVELSIDGTPIMIRATYAQSTTMPVVTTHEGWYPIRGAMTDQTGSAKLQLFETASSVTSTVPASRFRTRTTDARGLVTYAYFLEEMEIGPGVTLDPGPIDHETLAPGPSDFGLTTTFSLRYLGQVLVDEDGMYVAAVTFGADPDDGFRLWIDGELVADRWLTLLPRSTSDPLQLKAGWHAIMIDYGNNAGAASIHLRLGRDAASLAPVPADHLRPTIPYGAVNALGSKTPAMWADGGSASYDMTAFVSGGEVIDTVDLEYGVTARGVTMTLDQGGPLDPIMIHAMPNELDFPGSLYDYDALRAGYRDQPLSGAWHLRVTDPVVDGLGGSVSGAVMFTYHGGPMKPFEEHVRYTSPPRMTPGATAYTALHVTGDLHGAQLAIAMRTAATVDELDAQPWSPVDNDAPPAVIPADAVQYQLVITGTGWQFATVDRVELDYR